MSVAEQGKFFGRMVMLICIIAVITIAASVYVRYRNIIDYQTERSEKYFAVYVDNGQVYFGHLVNESTNYPELTDIFYLKQADGTSKTQYSLVKLGKELHGPKDQIVFNLQHVLYWEELDSDSAVLAAIKDYKKNGSAKVKSSETTQTPSTTETTKTTDTTKTVETTK